MLTYDLDQRGTLSLYEYLYRCIRRDILSGTLAAGERLPSKRRLAEHLRLSVMTVEGAYRQLEAEGYLYTRPRQGFFVSPVEPSLPVPPAPAPPEEHPPAWRLDLASSQADGGRFPVSTWARLTRQVLSEGRTFLDPVPPQGLPALRKAIAESLRTSKGMAVSPGQIVVGAGAEYLYLLLAQLLGRDAVLAVEDPGYSKIRQIYGKWGLTCRPVPLDGQGMDPAALAASGAGAAHLSPSHHYPTGIVTPIARRQSLLRWAEDTGGVIIEDDYDSEFRFTGRPLPTLHSIDTGGRVIYLNTFSQTLSPSLRMGFLVLPPALADRYRRELSFYACTVPALEQHVLARFLSGGFYDRHLSRLRKEYRARRAAVLEAFRTGIPAGRVEDRGAGLHFLLRLDTALSDETLLARAKELGVHLRFLSSCTALPEHRTPHVLVVSYAALDADRLPQAVSLLNEILRP